MRAEAAFAQGRFTDAHIELESAYARIEGNGQENMALCCDFLAWRLSLCTDVEMRYSFEQRRESSFCGSITPRGSIFLTRQALTITRCLAKQSASRRFFPRTGSRR